MKTHNFLHKALLLLVWIAHVSWYKIKFSDFGFAQYLCDDTDAQTLRGSPLYMAPEIITQRLYTAKADLWSVGVIMYGESFGVGKTKDRYM
jgi:serine/threonine protein kinase